MKTFSSLRLHVSLAPFLFVRCQGSFLSLCSPFKLLFFFLPPKPSFSSRKTSASGMSTAIFLEISPADELSPSAVGNLLAVIAEQRASRSLGRSHLPKLCFLCQPPKLCSVWVGSLVLCTKVPGHLLQIPCLSSSQKPACLLELNIAAIFWPRGAGELFNNNTILFNPYCCLCH